MFKTFFHKKKERFLNWRIMLTKKIIRKEVFSLFHLLKKTTRKKRGEDGSWRLILDVGTEFMKAGIICFQKETSQLVGYGKVKQDYSHMEGGAISNIEGVARAAQKAMATAAERPGELPSQVVMGIAGEFVKGVVTTRKKERRSPKRPITGDEIMEMVKKGQHHGALKAREILLTEVGLSDMEVVLLDSSIVEVCIDGYRVTDPSAFQGKNLSLTLFNTFAPLVHVGALKTLAQILELTPQGVMAEPMAIARSLLNPNICAFGAIVVDIGGGTTDVALIRNGGVEATRMLAMGGRAFTRSLAQELNVGLDEAECLKLEYSLRKKNGGGDGEDLCGERCRLVEKILHHDLQVLYEGLELILSDLAKEEALPKNIYFCGGGSALFGLVEKLEERRFYETLPFFDRPRLLRLAGKDITGLLDPESLLVGTGDVTPRSLALQAASLSPVHLPTGLKIPG